MTPKLAERLSKLIPRLASDADGEVLSTVRAIRAALLGEGLDLHDLAASIARSEVVAIPRAPQIAAAPTWSHLTHQERCAWMLLVLAESRLGTLEFERLHDLGALLKTGMVQPTHWRHIRRFDEKVAVLHARGMRA